MEMEQTVVPQIEVSDANKNADAKAHALTGNTMTDLENIAKELGADLGSVMKSDSDTGQDVRAAEPIAEKISEAQPEKTEVEVPQKFQKPDGTPDEAKIEKSTQSLDQMIARYKEKEREFSKLQNKVNNAPTTAVHQEQPRLPQPLTPLEVQMAQDIIAESKALGAPIAEAHAIALARVQAKVAEARYQADLSVTEDLRRRVEETERTNELQSMLNENSDLLEPAMVDKLMQIRQDFPWVNSSPTPWRAAYMVLKGTESAQQVKTTTPKGPTAKAPATPVGPVARVVNTGPSSVKDAWGMDMASLEAEIRRQNPGFRGR